MFQILMLIAVGLVAYSVTSGKIPALSAPEYALTDRVRIDGDFLMIETVDPPARRLFPLDEIDYIAIRTASGDQPYRLILGFGGDTLELSETQSGVEAVVDHLLHHPPKGTDFSRFGEAMEARRKKLITFLDRRDSIS
jgi:hypothetical protein